MPRSFVVRLNSLLQKILISAMIINLVMQGLNFEGHAAHDLKCVLSISNHFFPSSSRMLTVSTFATRKAWAPPSCVPNVTSTATTGASPTPARSPGSPTCSTTWPPSSSPSSCPCGVSRTSFQLAGSFKSAPLFSHHFPGGVEAQTGHSPMGMGSSLGRGGGRDPPGIRTGRQNAEVSKKLRQNEGLACNGAPSKARNFVS